MNSRIGARGAAELAGEIAPWQTMKRWCSQPRRQMSPASFEVRSTATSLWLQASIAR